MGAGESFPQEMGFRLRYETISLRQVPGNRGETRRVQH